MTLLLVGIFAGVCTLLYRSFMPAYYSEKGKNLATREDIALITKEIEAVKSAYGAQLKELEHQNALLLEEVRGKHQLRLAAVDKRLEVHQQGYTHWRKLMANLQSKEIGAIVFECQTWWENNCLYLSPSAREAFMVAYHSAMIQKSLYEARSDGNALKNNLERIAAAGKELVAGVALPSLGESETKNVAAP